MFEKPFSFEGRIRRTEFGITFIIALVAIFGINMAVVASESTLLFLGYIPVYWFLWAQGAKRCHDRGNTGWFQLIPFYALWMLFGDGEEGENIYGLNPKGIGNPQNSNEEQLIS